MKNKVILVFGLLSLLVGIFLFNFHINTFGLNDLYESLFKYNDEYIKENKIDDGKISLNNATLKELMTLEQIGTIRANNIIEYRKTQRINDPYELVTSKIITESIYEKIKDKVTI